MNDMPDSVLLVADGSDIAELIRVNLLELGVVTIVQEQGDKAL
jgi:hypothetical protein